MTQSKDDVIKKRVVQNNPTTLLNYIYLLLTDQLTYAEFRVETDRLEEIEKQFFKEDIDAGKKDPDDEHEYAFI